MADGTSPIDSLSRLDVQYFSEEQVVQRTNDFRPTPVVRPRQLKPTVSDEDNDAWGGIVIDGGAIVFIV